MSRLTKLTASLIPACARILREEWPKITEERLHEVVRSDHNGSVFPCSLVMLKHQPSRVIGQHQPTRVIGHCRITQVVNFASSTYIESIVVDKALRGQGLGRQILNSAEDYVKGNGVSRMFLSCLPQTASIYVKNGYRFCQPNVGTLGSAMLGSSRPPPFAMPVPGWEHLYTNTPDNLDNNTNEEEESYNQMKSIKMRAVRYYDDSMEPELSVFGYAWLAKELT